MRRPVEPQTQQAALVADEETLLQRVQRALARRAAGVDDDADEPTATDYDKDLIALRDQIAEEKPEDLASLVEQMTRVQALASGRRQRAVVPVDAGNPYFAHLKLRTTRGKGARAEQVEQDVLIGKNGLIDRPAGVQIVDWRDAPISQIYYRYDEGDDYDEDVGDTHLAGEVLARRNVTIAAGRLRRIGCPQGSFVSSLDGRWWELEGQGVALLGGGAGTAARPPRQMGPATRRGPGDKRRFETARTSAGRTDTKQLPEIAALLDGDQFDLITKPSTGLVVIQGGAGSGKTTVALHRIAFLVFHDRSIKPSHCLFVVPSEALARYVSGVLPALGVQGVPVTTYRAWARHLRKRLVPSVPDQYADETPPAVARLKKHPGLLHALRGAVEAEVAAERARFAPRLPEGAARDAVLAVWDAESRRPPLARLRAVKRRLEAAGLSPAQAETAELGLKQARKRLSDVRRILWELYTDRGRVGAALAGGPEPASDGEVDELVRWCAAQLDDELPAELEGIDEERLQPVDGRPLSDTADRAETAAAGKLDVEDDPLLLHLYQLVHGQLERVDGAPLVYDHVAIDEAQDLSPAEVKVLYEALTERRSLTICGDVAQRVVFDNAFRGWEGLLRDLGLGEGDAPVVSPLKLAYRSTAPIMQFARDVLGPLAGPAEPISARDGAPVELHEFGGMGEAVAFLGDALRSLISREPSASVALLARHPGQSDAWYAALQRAEVPSLRRVRRQDFAFTPGVDVTEVGQVKGLEFDYVVLLDVNQTSYAASVEARHLLHIGATRATHQLWLMATDRVSELVDEVAKRAGEEEGAGAAPSSEGARS